MKAAAYLWIALGGSLGSVLRVWISQALPTAFPVGTLVVNIGGSLMLGLVVGYDVLAGNLHPHAKSFFALGFCGAFTTFSTFSYQTLQLLQKNQPGLALLNIGLNLLLTVLAVYLGMRLGQSWGSAT